MYHAKKGNESQGLQTSRGFTLTTGTLIGSFTLYQFHLNQKDRGFNLGKTLCCLWYVNSKRQTLTSVPRGRWPDDGLAGNANSWAPCTARETLGWDQQSVF